MTRPLPRRSWIIIAAAAVLLIVATLVIYRHERIRIDNDARSSLNRDAEFTTRAIALRLQEYSHLLDSARALLITHGDVVSRDSWRTFTDSLDVPKRYPGITCTGYIAAVPGAERAAFVERARRDMPSFSIRPANEGAESFVILHVEPRAENQAAIGFDIASERSRRDAAVASRDSGQTAMTEPIVLVQDKSGRPGFLMLCPVETANGHFLGWVYIGVKYEDFFRSLHLAEASNLSFAVWSRRKPSVVIYRHGVANSTNDRTVEQPIDIFATSLVASFSRAPGAGADRAARRELGSIAIGGSLITIFVLMILWSFANTRARAVSLADDMTSAFRRGERNLRDLVDSIADAVIAIDGDSRIESFSRAASAIFGYDANEVIGKPLTLLLPSFRRDLLQEETIELRANRRDGTARLVEISSGEIHRESGTSVVVIARDVTERRRAEREIRLVETFSADAAHAKDEKRLFDIALSGFCKSLELPMGEAWVPREGRLVRVHSWHRDSPPLADFDRYSGTFTFSRGEGLPGKAWATRGSQILTDFSAGDFVRRGAAIAAGLTAGLALPVRGDNDTLAILTFFTADKSATIDARDTRLAVTIASHLAESIRSKRAEAGLRESEARYRDLFENASDLIQFADATGHLVYVNSAWLRTLGYDQEEINTLTLFDIIAPEQHDHCRDILKRRLRGDGAQQNELTFITSRGERRIVEGTLIVRASGDTRGIFRDVTEQRLAQQQVAESRDRLRAVLDAATEVSIIGTNQEGLITTFNTGAERLLGYSAGEMIGIQTPVVFHDHAEVVARGAELSARFGRRIEGFDVFVEAARSGRSEEREWTYIRKDNARRTVSLVVTATHDTHGSLDGFLGVARDITDRKRAEESLRANRQSLQSLMENSLDGILTFTRDGLIETINPAACEILGYRAAELEGQPLTTLVPNGVSNAEEYLREAHRRSLGQVTEWEVRKKSGEPIPIELALFEFGTAEGSRFAGMFQDLSRRKEVERLKSEFVSTVSHELRTPLTSIRGSLDLLAGGVFGALPPGANEVVTIAHKNSTRLIGLINDILDLDRLDSGRLDMSIVETSLHELIRSSIDSVSAFAASQQISIEAAPTFARVLADSDRIVQVLVNLLSNAIKFSPQGSTITISSAERDDRVVVSVSDHGRGIPERFQERIFNRFQQVESSDARSKGGSGLGLAICKAIIEEHHGRVGVESVEGAGSTFWFELPRVNVSKPRGRKPALLLYEPSGTNDRLAELFKSEGLTVIESPDEETFLRAAMSGESDVAVIVVGDADRETLLHDIGAAERSSSIPIVVVAKQFPAVPLRIPGAVSYILADITDSTQLTSMVRSIVTDATARDVLVIEDDEALLDIITRQLSAEQLSIRQARTVTAALEQIRAMRPRLVILDVGLPDGDGFQIIRELQKDAALRELRVLVYTGRYLSADEKKRLTLGRTRFLTKSKATDDEFKRLVMNMVSGIDE